MREFQPGKMYRHYKGNHYKALCIATHTETEEPMAVYQALYGEHGIWARPLAMFLEDVSLPDGTTVPRFAPVDDAQE